MWEDPLIEWADGQMAPFTINLALEAALKVPVEHQGRAEQMRVGSILKAHGFERFRQRDGVRLKWFYRRPEPPDDAQGGNSLNPGGNNPESAAASALGGNNADVPTVVGEGGNGKAQQKQPCSYRSYRSYQLEETTQKPSNGSQHEVFTANSPVVGTVGTVGTVETTPDGPDAGHPDGSCPPAFRESWFGESGQAR